MNDQTLEMARRVLLKRGFEDKSKGKRTWNGVGYEDGVLYERQFGRTRIVVASISPSSLIASFEGEDYEAYIFLVETDDEKILETVVDKAIEMMSLVEQLAAVAVG